MPRNYNWEPPIKNLEKVTADAYKIIFEEAQARFEECASESESITDKSIKIFIGIVSVGAFCVGFFFNRHQPIFLIVGLAILLVIFFIDIRYLYILIAPRHIYHRGTSPKTLFPSELDQEIQEEQVSIVYHSALINYQDKIEKFYELLDKRTLYYKRSIVLSLVILIGASLLFGISLISHP